MLWSKRDEPTPNNTAVMEMNQSKDSDHEPPAATTGATEEQVEEQDKQYPGIKVVLLTTLSVVLAVFLVSLDRTIVGVAVPAISNEFNSFVDIPWYETAYLLTSAALQLPAGKFYTIFPTKWVFITFVLIFELGSIVCAAAPTSTAFIIGRAISGLGSAGVSIGGILIFVDILPLHKRPKYQGAIGASFGLSSILGPLLGGVFTSKTTWRWCFWINLPVGGVALVALLLILPASPPAQKQADGTFLQRLKVFDPVGTLLLLPGLILLLLALQWGGNQYPWDSARVIACLVLGVVLLLAFAVSQAQGGDLGTVPPRILKQRSVAAATAIQFGFGATLLILTFYLPIWYQAIQGLSAIDAGIRLLPYFLVTVFFVIGSGILLSKIGYYSPILMFGTAVAIIGCGLLSTFHVGTSTATTIGYQVVISAGLGSALMGSVNAIQTVLPPKDVPMGTTIVTFSQFLGGTIFISVCQVILTNTLRSRLTTQLPNLDIQSILSAGATNLVNFVSKDELPILLNAYNAGIVNIFYCTVGTSALAFISTLFLEWRSVRQSVDAQGNPIATKKEGGLEAVV